MNRRMQSSSCPPVVQSSAPHGERKHVFVDVPLIDDDVCAICLNVLDIRKEGDDEAALEATIETLRVLPCIHVFHKLCIFEWLSRHSSCPLCRYRHPIVNDGDEVEKYFD